MSKQNIETSGLTLAKGAELVGDDFYEVKVLDTITVAVLCDGVGSALRGAEAARRTTQFLIQSLKNRPRAWSIEKSIHHFIDNINRVLYLESMEDYGREELVTTLALVVIEGDRLYGANIGDSRIYLQRAGTLTQLSSDHAMDEEGMEGVLTSAIGLGETVQPYYFENNLNAGDRILLCSDGLYNELSDDQLLAGIKMGAAFLIKQASRLHEDNLPDDTTAITITIKELDPRLRLKQSNLTLQRSYKKGEVIDGYRLKKPLIQNQRTWLVEKRGMEYVLKFAPFESLDDEKILDLYVKEVWNAKRLKAGFFPKAAVPRNRTHRYYLMRHIKGITLKEHLSHKPLSVDDAIELGYFLLKMAQFLIRKDLVHGDIKPENIIRSKRKGKTVFTMIDFGSITEVYSTTTRAGTPSYLAPERFDQAPISEQSELYAIGVVLYEALTQSLPYGEIEPFQTPSFDRSVPHPTRLNPRIPEWLESVILHALHPDTDKRYSHYSEMMHDLKHPERVKPFWDTHTSIVERNPLAFCKIGFVVMLVLNIYLLTR